MQKTTDNGVTVLTADAGMRLTNGDAFGTTVRLGKGASANEWREVTVAEAEQMQADNDEELTAEEALSIITGGGSDA